MPKLGECAFGASSGVGTDGLEFLWAADDYFPRICEDALSPLPEGQQRIIIFSGWFYRSGTCIHRNYTFGQWVKELCLRGYRVAIQWNQLPDGTASELISEIVGDATADLSPDDLNTFNANFQVLISSLITSHWPSSSTDEEKAMLYSSLSPWLVNPLIQPLGTCLPREHFQDPLEKKLELASHHQKCAIILDVENSGEGDDKDENPLTIAKAVTYVGGMDFNLQVAGYDESASLFRGRNRWHDLSIRVEDNPVVTSACVEVFTARWRAQMQNKCAGVGTDYIRARELLTLLDHACERLTVLAHGTDNAADIESHARSERKKRSEARKRLSGLHKVTKSEGGDTGDASGSEGDDSARSSGSKGGDDSSQERDAKWSSEDESFEGASDHDVDSDEFLFSPFPTESKAAKPEARLTVVKTMPPVLLDFTSHVETIEAVLDLIANASETIYIENQYFRHKEITSALLQKAYNGVKVTIVVPRQTEETSDALALSGNKGVTRETATPEMIDPLNKVFLYARYQALSPLVAAGAVVMAPEGRESPYLHSKMIIVDSKAMYLGSANFCERSMNGRMDSELGLVIRDVDFVATVSDLVNSTRYREALQLAPYDIEYDNKLSVFPVGGAAWNDYWDFHSKHLPQALPASWWDERFDAVLMAHFDLRQLFYAALYDLL